MFMPIDKVVDLIRGKENSDVRLKVEPSGAPPGETKLIVIRRGKVELKDEQVSAEVIEMKADDGTPKRLVWMTIPSFYGDFDDGSTRVSVDVEKLLQRLMDERMDGLVLDLRNNGGGLLEEVRRMTGFFINRGPVVQVKNTLGQIQIKDSSLRQPIYSGPLVVVTDKSSASASEILAGALQDFNRAVIVGDSSTFGKGTVQQPMDIGRMLPLFAARDRAGFLKVTIQKYYRPSGSSTQLEGVEPDIVLPGIIDAMEIGEAYLDHALVHDRIRQAPDFNPYDRDNLFLMRLQELSAKRVKDSKDFAYIVEDVIKTKGRMQENRVSLNKAEREKELLDADRQQDERNAERRVRFAKMEEQDHERMKFFRLNLEMLEKKAPMQAFDPTADDESFMRRAKEQTAELDDTPKWPNGMDPVKREAIEVLRDLVNLTETARMAGLLKKSDVR
jgi:carboxyl-terminal processing protease